MTAYRFRALVFVLAVLVAWAASAAAPDGPRSTDPDGARVQVRDGLLTVEARDARLATVLRMIGEQAGFDVVIEGDPGVRVSRSFTGLPLNEGLTDLLDGVSFVMVFGGPEGVDRLDELRVYPAMESADSGGEPLRPTASLVETRSQAEMETWILDRLGSPDRGTRIVAVRRLARLEPEVAAAIAARVLEFEDDAVVRGQTVATLGKIGGDEAFGLLEAALGNEEASVRKHAVRALRLFGPEQAAPVLGSALVEDSDQEIRLMALESLIAISNETSRRYLKLAATDPDETIRQRANQALQASKNGQPPK